HRHSAERPSPRRSSCGTRRYPRGRTSHRLHRPWPSTLRKETFMKRLTPLLVLAALVGTLGCTKAPSEFTVAMMPKNKGNPYFVSCREGAGEAPKEMGGRLLWDGPTETDPAKQNEVVETWITRGVDVIAASVENRDGLATVLRQARDKGIKVVTWDADTTPEARDLCVNQATPEGIGYTLVDRAAELLG